MPTKLVPLANVIKAGWSLTIFISITGFMMDEVIPNAYNRALSYNALSSFLAMSILLVFPLVPLYLFVVASQGQK